MGGGTFGEVDALVVVRDAAANHAYAGGLQLIKQDVLIGYAGAHGVDSVDTDDHVLGACRAGQEGDRNDS